MPLTQEMRAKICRLADARGLVGTITNADAIAIRRELGLSPNRHSAVMLVLQQRICCGPPNKDGVYVLSRFPVGYAPTPEIQAIARANIEARNKAAQEKRANEAVQAARVREELQQPQGIRTRSRQY